MTSYEKIINYRKTNTLKPNISLDLIFKKIAETITVAAKVQEREPQRVGEQKNLLFLKRYLKTKMISLLRILTLC